MPKFSRSCKCLVISGILTTCALAETLAAPSDGTDILDHARVLLEHGRNDEAKALLTGKQMGTFRNSNPVIDAEVLDDLGVIFYREGMFQDAEAAYSRAIGLLRQANGENTPAQVDPLANLADLLYEGAQFSRSEKLLTREIAILNAAPESGQIGTRSILARTELAKVYLCERKYDLAAETAENLIKGRSGADRVGESAAALGYSILGAIASEQGQQPAAEADLHEAISILEKVLGPDDVRIGEAIGNLGLLYATSGEMGKAEPLLGDAYMRLAARANSLYRRVFLLRYAEAESKAGNKKKARALLNESRALEAASPATFLSRYVVDASAFRR
jgi:tetratricopeptide (TPR) repeat protein